MKVYIAGPMTNYPQYNFPAFDYRADQLRAAGHEVVSPAELDRAAGFDGTTLIAEGDKHAFHRAAMLRDVAAVCDVEGICLLDGWENSKGSKFEIACAEFLGLPVFMPGIDPPEPVKSVAEDSGS